ncbi:MAG: hypothetical protein H6581_28130 [Bacteroidia bacterium]|nr:hypothetical protein [Bacteroidia bacterium]
MIKSWDQGSIIFEATLNHGDSVGVAAYDFSSIWLDDLLIISYSNVDSNVVVFDQVKRWNNEVVGQATLYKATNCEKDRKQISCDRTFHITNSHYAQADSI